MDSIRSFGIHEKNPHVHGGLAQDGAVVSVFMDTLNFGWPPYVKLIKSKVIR